VVCPDLPGWGRSGRVRNPDDYSLPQYCSDVNALLARLGVAQVDWVGTSLGGLIGVAMGGFPGSILRKLVINDIGPYVSSTGLSRIGRYIGEMPAFFATIDEAERYFRAVLKPYGYLDDEHWRRVTVHSVAWNAQTQRYAMLCDPAIAKAFKTPWFYPSLDLWKYWEAIKVPVLVLHGAKSDLLSDDLTREMRRRNGNAEVVRFEDCGHLPPLVARDQIEIVTKFLESETEPDDERAP
jgi:pimeloyl-ACP methyl ester carboxylesterase